MIQELQQQQAAMRNHIGMSNNPINLAGNNNGDIDTTIHDKVVNDTLDAAEARRKEQVRKEGAVARAAKKKGEKPPIEPKPILGPLELPSQYVAHGLTWYRDMPTEDINGYRGRHNWEMRSSTPGIKLYENSDVAESHSLWWYFLQCFPLKHLPMMVELTNKQLAQSAQPCHEPTNQNKLIKFFRIILLIPRMPDIPRRDMWNKKASSRYGVSANLNRTGMSRHRFEAILSCIRFSCQLDVRPYGMSDETHRWGLVNHFVDAFNRHREENFSPGGVICVDESMVRWYGLGGSWISKGLPHFVALDRKPEDGCEIQDACCGITGIMIRMEVVKSAQEHAHLKSKQGTNGGYGTSLRGGILDLAEFLACQVIDANEATRRAGQDPVAGLGEPGLDHTLLGHGGESLAATVPYPDLGSRRA